MTWLLCERGIIIVVPEATRQYRPLFKTGWAFLGGEPSRMGCAGFREGPMPRGLEPRVRWLGAWLQEGRSSPFPHPSPGLMWVILLTRPGFR